ncbi:hypothetical protein PQ478_08440 [Alkalihalophilus pseudofirmus]|uniref:hypothetical protein n=1 Tax=Alkalihalophilus pseudofirmus TaxID=79885 RepID=UPI00259B6BDE|nr:hypothetical protein [Alkalihalophilus pseudofirmus]WEG18496.1 hypothetical protein PQ478_08440 [Alkalihalophilus pseudofirmus]
MKRIPLNQIEDRVRKNNIKYADAISRFQSETKKRNLISGRVRPKHPTEANILSSFTRK